MDKYVISEADYAARDNTYRKFKEAKLKEDPTWTLEKEMAARAGEGRRGNRGRRRAWRQLCQGMCGASV